MTEKKKKGRDQAKDVIVASRRVAQAKVRSQGMDTKPGLPGQGNDKAIRAVIRFDSVRYRVCGNSKQL
jgi:hypothetical protein